MTDRRSRSRWLRKRLRLSIRGFIALVLLVGGGLGWIIHQAKVQRDCVTAVTRAQGTVIYNWFPDYPDSSAMPVPRTSSTQELWISGQARGSDSKPWVPRWLVDRLGVDYFAHVICVRLPVKVERIDELMASVASLSRLEELDLQGSGVTDIGLSQIGGLTGLRRLALSGTAISDAGMVHLRGLTGLEELTLSRSRIGDAGLVHLISMSALQKLYLNETQVGDLGLSHLKKLTRLEKLYLRHTRITDAGLEHLKGLPNLPRTGPRAHPD